MKRAIVLIVFAVVFQGIARSQFANPFISVNMSPGKILLTKMATLEVQAGNAGNSPIQPNSLQIIINAGAGGEITGIRADGSDKRWTIQSMDKGPGNTLVLVNLGNKPFQTFDLGIIYVLFTGKSASEKSEPVVATIKYLNNSEQGNASTLDDFSQTSLWVYSGTTPIKNGKPVANVIPEKQDLAISADGCDAILNWKINPKKKIERIEVEFSKTNVEFLKLGEALPKQGAGPGEYEYKHDQGNAKGYYRLKLWEAGNSFEYSKVKDITTTCIIKKGF